MKRPTDDHLNRLLLRIHVHDDYCYGQYQPCGEHHAHDDSCGSRPLLCGKHEGPDAPALFAVVAELKQRRAYDLTDEERLALRGCSIHCMDENQLQLATSAIDTIIRGSQCRTVASS